MKIQSHRAQDGIRQEIFLLYSRLMARRKAHTICQIYHLRDLLTGDNYSWQITQGIKEQPVCLQELHLVTHRKEIAWLGNLKSQDNLEVWMQMMAKARQVLKDNL